MIPLLILFADNSFLYSCAMPTYAGVHSMLGLIFGKLPHARAVLLGRGPRRARMRVERGCFAPLHFTGSAAYMVRRWLPERWAGHEDYRSEWMSGAVLDQVRAEGRIKSIKEKSRRGGAQVPCYNIPAQSSAPQES